MSELVSVILCVYNGQDYLEESINSLLMQTYNEIEIIIIDDGSTDRSWSIIKQLSNENKSKIIAKKTDNQGLTKSLNFGLSFAKGAYVARQDADDVSELNRVEVCVNSMKENSCDLLLSRFSRFNNEGVVDIRPKNLNIYSKGITLQHLQYGNPFCHGTFFIKSSVIKNYRYREFYEKSQDYDLLLRLVKDKYEIKLLKDVLYNLRIHSQSISSTAINSQADYAQKALVDSFGKSTYFINNKPIIYKFFLRVHRIAFGWINAKFFK